MKTNLIKVSAYFSLIGAILLLSQAAFSQEEFSREYEKKYSCSKQTNFKLYNKYGDIEIKDWQKDEINIVAKIVLKGISEQKADEVFKLVKINFSQEGNSIRVETDYDDAFFKMINRNLGNKNRFEVNYVISMPSYIKSDIENKYGSLFISKLTSASRIKVKYGNLKINQLEGAGKDQMVNIELGYSDGTIESCQWLKIMCKYSKLYIQESKALIIMSKYSKLTIDKGSSIVSESKYDGFKIGTLANFVTESEYSNFKFNEISKKIRLNTKYTDFKVERVTAGFELIEIENKYGSINIGIEEGASYRLKGYAQYAKIHYPSNARINRHQENTELRVEGIVGDDSSELPKVSIQTKYGGVNLTR
jgi:hypothetical protein